jgi:RalA-binding protein 1
VTSPPSRNSADSFGTTAVQPTRKLGKALSKDDIARGPAVPLAKLPSEMQHGKLFAEGSQNPSSAVDRYPPMELPRRHDSQQSHLTPNMHEPEHLSASLPSTSPLETPVAGPSARSNSELGHYPDLSDSHTSHLNQSTPSRADRSRRQSYAPSLGTVQASPTVKSERPTTPDLPATNQSIYPHISGPTNGIVLPSGFKFGSKDSSSDHPVSDRDRKTKSTAFWRFGRSGEKQTTLEAPRAVFGVTLTDTLSVVQIANLPAVVFRCIQYLEAKKADEEEGIYRLSGSSAVIKGLKDRFNAGEWICDTYLMATDSCIQRVMSTY